MPGICLVLGSRNAEVEFESLSLSPPILSLNISIVRDSCPWFSRISSPMGSHPISRRPEKPRIASHWFEANYVAADTCLLAARNTPELSTLTIATGTIHFVGGSGLGISGERAAPLGKTVSVSLISPPLHAPKATNLPSAENSTWHA